MHPAAGLLATSLYHSPNHHQLPRTRSLTIMAAVYPPTTPALLTFPQTTLAHYVGSSSFPLASGPCSLIELDSEDASTLGSGAEAKTIALSIPPNTTVVLGKDNLVRKTDQNEVRLLLKAAERAFLSPSPLQLLDVPPLSFHPPGLRVMYADKPNHGDLPPSGPCHILVWLLPDSQVVVASLIIQVRASDEQQPGRVS